MVQRFLRLLRGLDRAVAAVEVALATALLLGMVGMYSVHVVARNTGYGGVPVFQQVVQHLVLWVAVIGASLCVRERRHIAIEVVHKAVSPSGRRVVDGLVTQSTLLVCLLLAWISWEYASFLRTQYEAMPVREPLFCAFGIDVPPWWSSTILPVGFVVMAARYGLRLLERIFVDEPVDTEAEVRKEIAEYERRRSSEEDAFAGAPEGAP